MAPDNAPPSSDTTDCELLRIMATVSRGTAKAQGAWAEFYLRHRRYMFGVCWRAFRDMLGGCRIEEIVHDTFIRAYERAGTYTASGDSDEITARRRVRAWLGRISENIVHDLFRHEPALVLLDEITEDLAAPEVGVSDDCPPTAELARLEAAFDNLSDREQEVLRTTSFWIKPEQRQQRLPNSVMAKLAASLNTTPENIRQIRARAMSKLRLSLADQEEEG